MTKQPTAGAQGTAARALMAARGRMVSLVEQTGRAMVAAGVVSGDAVGFTDADGRCWRLRLERAEPPAWPDEGVTR